MEQAHNANRWEYLQKERLNDELRRHSKSPGGKVDVAKGLPKRQSGVKKTKRSPVSKELF
jgi:hypothetical protein